MRRTSQDIESDRGESWLVRVRIIDRDRVRIAEYPFGVREANPVARHERADDRTAGSRNRHAAADTREPRTSQRPPLSARSSVRNRVREQGRRRRRRDPSCLTNDRA